MNTQTDTTPVSAWQRVPVVMDYYDVPLIGVANFEGVPHAFVVDDEIVRKTTEQEREEWGEETVREMVYNLYAIEPDMLRKVMEKQELFERWHEAWAAKTAGMGQHPALPEDRARYDELKAELDPWKESLKHLTPAKVRIGDFVSNAGEVAPGRSRWTSFQVLWSEVPII